MLKRIDEVVATLQVEALRNLPAEGPKRSLQDAVQEQRQMMAIERTALLLGSFRRSDADDPEIFGRAIEHVLARYDVDIQIAVTEPGRFPFPPSAYELRQACEAIASERARANERDERIAKQLKERRELDAAASDRKALTYQPRGPAVIVNTGADRERREAEAILARYLAEANTSAKPVAPSVFELDPADWNGGPEPPRAA